MKKAKANRVLIHSLVFCLAQVVQELISERLFDGKTNGPNSMASLALFYSFSQQFCCTALSLGMIQYQDRNDTVGDKRKHHPPSWNVVLVLAGLVAVSSSMANWSVEFVIYPAKVVMKSTKLVPVMVLSPLLGNSAAFTAVDYVSALCLSVGAAGFALSNGRGDLTSPDLSLAWIGLLLLSLAALADAVIPNLQQRTMRRGARPEEMALRVNFVSSSVILVSLVSSGNLKPWLELWQSDTSSFWLMAAGGITFSVAVLSYTFLIVEAGSVAAVSVATIRKVATLALSYVFFPDKTLSAYHVASLGVFALGLGLRPLLDLTRPKPKKQDDISII